MALTLEAPYVTHDEFMSAGLGIDISDVSQTEMIAILRRASRAVDGWCKTSFHPRQEVERHVWNFQTRRIWPHHLPVVAVDALRIGDASSQNVRLYVSNQQYATLGATECFINNDQGWIEILSLTSVYAVSAPIIMLGLTTPTAELIYTTGYGARAVLDSGSADASNTKLYWFTHPLWTMQSHSTVSEFAKHAVQVYIGGVLQASTSYTVDPVAGTVLFNSVPGGAVTATYWYSLIPEDIKWGTIAVATALLGERGLARQQMTGLRTASLGGVSFTRKDEPDWPITQEAKTYLGRYQGIGLR